MFAFLSNFFEKEMIQLFAALPLSGCIITKPYLLEREGITDGTVIIMAVPYYTPACDDPMRNISAYAVSKDYHLYFQDLFTRLLPQLQVRYPHNRFAGFADHSPIAEQDAATKAGLGILGKNHLLLTEPYSSYIFLGEIITDAHLDCACLAPGYCENCGACLRACPAKNGSACLSALTQSKKLTSEEIAYLQENSGIWGCDLCQEICPHTKKAKEKQSIYSPIPFFYSNPLPYLSSEILERMDDASFSQRAYAWRGRTVIERNLKLTDKTKKGGGQC